MADRDRFGGSDRDYAYTDYSGRRGLDVRNPADAARQRQQFQYRDKGRTVVSDTEPDFTDMGRNRNVPFPQITGTPNFRPPYGAPGQPSYGAWMQQIDPYADPYSPKKHPNPRMRGMMGGLGGLQEQAGLWQDIKRILKNTKNPGPLIDQWTDHWNEQQTADVSGIMDKYNQFTDQFGEIGFSGDEIDYGIDFNVPGGGIGTFDTYYDWEDDDYGGGLNFTWPIG